MYFQTFLATQNPLKITSKHAIQLEQNSQYKILTRIDELHFELLGMSKALENSLTVYTNLFQKLISRYENIEPLM